MGQGRLPLQPRLAAALGEHRADWGGEVQFLHEKSAEEMQDGANRATKHIDTSLNLIGGRLGLDHDQVFFGRFAIPVMVRYLDQRKGPMRREGAGQAAVLVRAGAACGGVSRAPRRSYIDQDLAALEGEDEGLDKLLGAIAPLAR